MEGLARDVWELGRRFNETRDLLFAKMLVERMQSSVNKESDYLPLVLEELKQSYDRVLNL